MFKRWFLPSLCYNLINIAVAYSVEWIINGELGDQNGDQFSSQHDPPDGCCSVQSQSVMQVGVLSTPFGWWVSTLFLFPWDNNTHEILHLFIILNLVHKYNMKYW